MIATGAGDRDQERGVKASRARVVCLAGEGEAEGSDGAGQPQEIGQRSVGSEKTGMVLSMAVTVYQYPKCSTCRKALAWLDREGVAYESVNIVDAPPSKATLRQAQKLAGVPVSKMFNTSGQSYRDGGFKAKLAKMSDDQAFDALANDGKLIKRPLVLGAGFALVGFREPEWAEKIRR